MDFDRLNTLIKECGITKAFIASRLGRQRQLLNNWERGKSQPSESDLAAIAEMLNTTVAYLSGETDEKIQATQGGQPVKLKKLLYEAGDLADQELDEVLDHMEYIKSKRKKQ